MEVDGESKPEQTEEQQSAEEVKQTEEEKSSPIVPSTSLELLTKQMGKMKYHVTKCEDGLLRMLQTGSNEEFKFVDQKHYDKLGDLLCYWIQAAMVDSFKMN